MPWLLSVSHVHTCSFNEEMPVQFSVLMLVLLNAYEAMM